MQKHQKRHEAKALGILGLVVPLLEAPNASPVSPHKRPGAEKTEKTIPNGKKRMTRYDMKPQMYGPNWPCQMMIGFANHCLLGLLWAISTFLPLLRFVVVTCMKEVHCSSSQLASAPSSSDKVPRARAAFIIKWALRGLQERKTSRSRKGLWCRACSIACLLTFCSVPEGLWIMLK